MIEPMWMDENGRPHAVLTLRDWFAGQAMIVVAQMIDDGSMQEDEGPPLKGMAKACYELADAMLIARVTPPKGTP